MMNTSPSNTITLWVVDIASSSILMQAKPIPSNTKLATIQINNTVLNRLKTYQYAHIKTTALHNADNNLVQYVADKTALVQLGILHPILATNEQANQQKVTQYHFNDTILTCVPYRAMVDFLPTSTLHHASHALQIMRWRMEHRFCSHCGTNTHSDAHEYASVCPKCHHRSYPRIQPCVITAIIKNTDTKPQILLALHHRHLQKDNPYASMYGLIAGFVEIGENLESAVIREVKEETGLTVNHIRYIGSQPWPYPSNLMIGFVAEYTSGTLTPQADELYDAQFFDLDNLPTIPKIGTIARTLIEWVKNNLTIS